MRLRECFSCGLIWADTHIDSATVKAHFERAYKGHDYFVRRRHQIFKQLADLIDALTPRGGRVLDVGGAQGHLMDMVRRRRSDVTPVVNDLSDRALDFASRQLGLSVIAGALSNLPASDLPYDVVVASDVIYYEPDLRSFWNTIGRITTGTGTVIFRIPNRHGIIRGFQALRHLVATQRARRMQDSIRFFNPEHLYILSRTYLVKSLNRLGFRDVRIMPSPLLAPASHRQSASTKAALGIAVTINTILPGSPVVTPSMVVVARRAAARN